MMHNSQTHRDLEQGPVAIRALRSLNQLHVDAVQAAVAACGGDWVIGCHNDYDGYLSIIVERSDADNSTFLISGRLGHVELGQLIGDQLRQVGEFKVIEQVVTELVRLCSCSVG